METKEHTYNDLKARSDAEANKKKPEPKNKMRRPENKGQEAEHENSMGL